MSESSTPLDSIFSTQRTLIDRTIETQEEISRQSLDLTRQAVRPLADAAPAEDAVDEAEDIAEEATDDVEAAAEEFLDGLEDGVDATTDEFEAFYETLKSELDEFDEDSVESLLDEGVESLSDLTAADVPSVTEAVDATEDEARDLIDVAVDHEGENIADLEGIGQTYSDRLADASIRTQSDLSRTSAEAVADVAGVSEDRAAEWVQRAREQA